MRLRAFPPRKAEEIFSVQESENSISNPHSNLPKTYPELPLRPCYLPTEDTPMATQRQIEANRRNAQKCTGPRTPEGKARSSRNALKTGIDAKSAVLPSESAAKLDELTA